MNKELPNDHGGGNSDSSPQRQNVVRPTVPPPAQEAASARDHQAVRDDCLDLEAFMKPVPMQTTHELQAYIDTATPAQLRNALMLAVDGHLAFSEASAWLMDAIETAADLLRAGNPDRALKVLQQVEAAADGRAVDGCNG